MKYDSLGRMVMNAEPHTAPGMPTDAPAGTAWSAFNGIKACRYAYSPAGKLVATSDARGCGKNAHYDAAGRLVAEDVSPCLKTHPDYTAPELAANDVLTGKGTEAFNVYDAPEAGQTSYGFDVAVLRGRLAASSDRGAHVQMAYDARGRTVGAKKQIAKPGDAAEELGARYAPTWFETERQFDEAGRVERATTGADVAELQDANGESVLTFSYTARGLPKKVEGSYKTLLERAELDVEGRPVATLYGDGAKTRADYGYDPATGRLSTYALSRATMPIALPGYTPPAASPPSTLQKVLASAGFAYDAAGNVTSVTDTRTADEWLDGSKPTSRTMTYDDFDRLTKVTYAHDDDASVSPFEKETQNHDRSIVPPRVFPARMTEQTFDYDWKGNTTKTGDDQPRAFYDRSIGEIVNGETLGKPNQLVSASTPFGALAAKYDDAGNLVDLLVSREAGQCADVEGKCVHRFVYDWNEVGELARAQRWDYATTPTTGLYPTPPAGDAVVDLRYTYNAAGGRVIKMATDANGRRLFSVDIFGSLRLERTTWNTGVGTYDRSPLTEAVYLGGMARVVYLPVSATSGAPGGQRVFLMLGDHLGSTSTVIDKETGELAERVTYQAFGAVESDYRPKRWGSFRETFRFTGKEDDTEVGLTYFGARYCQAALGRWISADPLAVHGLGADLNPYAYVSGNVFNTVDPLGLNGREGSGGPVTGNTAGAVPSYNVSDGDFGKSVLDGWNWFRDNIASPAWEFIKLPYSLGEAVIDGISSFFAPTTVQAPGVPFKASQGSPNAAKVLYGNSNVDRLLQDPNALDDAAVNTARGTLLALGAIATWGVATELAAAGWGFKSVMALAHNFAARASAIAMEGWLGSEMGLAGAGAGGAGAGALMMSAERGMAQGAARAAGSSPAAQTVETEAVVAAAESIPSLKGLASTIRTAANHPAAAQQRTIAVAEDKAGQLWAGSSNGFDRGQRAMAEKLGITCVGCKADKHAEENLLRVVPNLKRIGTSVRNPCGAEEHNCNKQLLDALIEIEF